MIFQIMNVYNICSLKWNWLAIIDGIGIVLWIINSISIDRNDLLSYIFKIALVEITCSFQIVPLFLRYDLLLLLPAGMHNRHVVHFVQLFVKHWITVFISLI